MVREDIYQELYLAITELPEDCREIFWLYFQGKNNKEIAEILSLPEKDVRACKREADLSIKKPSGRSIFLVADHENRVRRRVKSS